MRRWVALTKPGYVAVIAATLITTVASFSTCISIADARPEGESVARIVEVDDESAVEEQYLICAQDLLEVSIWKNAELSRTVVVRPDGMITLPLLGDLRAEGRTPGALRDEIIDRLKLYQETAVASVIVLQTNGNRIYVIGEVTNPGTYALNGRTTVLQALAMAGGLSKYASRNSMTLVRKKKADEFAEEKMTIRFDDLVKVGTKKDRNVVLRPGDTIFVP